MGKRRTAGVAAMNLRQTSFILLVFLLLWGVGETGRAQAQSPRPPALDEQYYRAETAWKSGASPWESKARLDRVLSRLPDDQEARKLRAQVLLALDQPAEALRDARRAAELAPKDGEAHLIFSEAARVNGDRELALQQLSEAGDLLDEDAMMHVRLSWNAMMLNQPEQAEAYGRIALALDEALDAAYFQLARAFVQSGKPEEAVSVLERGLRASVLDAAAIRADNTLRGLADRAALRPFMDEN